jgi:hypothetical protein
MGRARLILAGSLADPIRRHRQRLRDFAPPRAAAVFATVFFTSVAQAREKRNERPDLRQSRGQHPGQGRAGAAEQLQFDPIRGAGEDQEALALLNIL